jgi:hypothetical protein
MIPARKLTDVDAPLVAAVVRKTAVMQKTPTNAQHMHTDGKRARSNGQCTTVSMRPSAYGYINGNGAFANRQQTNL